MVVNYGFCAKAIHSKALDNYPCGPEETNSALDLKFKAMLEGMKSTLSEIKQDIVKTPK
ncbi:MAG: hypothetical protein GAK29_05026 [Acinetobacter bereziniae]|uniref:Uncharacterized protein n=1 Tax=Acinetobacter bereziniae TaxID=106648 RepID=A0A833PAC8_ACIBZ|nr:MAG: hypothetical protein GAK29_05026 [Acinetobacter bereziniae]